MKNTDVDVEKASASEDAAIAMQKKALQIAVSYTHLTLPTTPYV